MIVINPKSYNIKNDIPKLNKEYTNEQSNLGYLFQSKNNNFNREFTYFEEHTDNALVDILKEIDSSIVFTREYEHAVGCITFDKNSNLSFSYLRMPHPSGIAFKKNSLFVFSTRTPHIINEFKLIKDSNYNSKQSLIMPSFSKILPGSYYAHEIIARDNFLYYNATGWNEIHKTNIDLRSSVDLFFSPSFLKKRKPNCCQLNSLTFSEKESFSTCFSSVDSEYKPWKDEKGPLQKGSLIRHSDSFSLVKGLTCPHSVRSIGENLFYCNSGFGELNQCNIDGSENIILNTLPGFTRGLAFSSNYLFVGLSKVQEGKDSYAPGLNIKKSLCGIAVLRRSDYQLVSLLSWPKGEQIFDIQLLPNKQFCNPRFPQSRDINSSQPSLDFYNWEINN